MDSLLCFHIIHWVVYHSLSTKSDSDAELRFSVIKSEIDAWKAGNTQWYEDDDYLFTGYGVNRETKACMKAYMEIVEDYEEWSEETLKLLNVEFVPKTREQLLGEAIEYGLKSPNREQNEVAQKLQRMIAPKPKFAGKN